MSNVFNEKYTDEQRAKLAEKLVQHRASWKTKDNLNIETTNNITLDKTKIEYIARKINILDLHEKEHVCKILLAHEIDVKQNNNGVYCRFDELSNELIDVIHEYIVTTLK
jgi:hypothetical protein